MFFQCGRRDVNACDIDETGIFQPTAQELTGWDQPEVAHPRIAAVRCQTVGVCYHQGLQEYLATGSCEIEQTLRMVSRIAPVINHTHAKHGIEFDLW